MRAARWRPWTIRDLRRTAATGMADLGVLPYLIEAALNHISGHKAGVAGAYNRSCYERETRAALALWADQLRSAVDGGERRFRFVEPGPRSSDGPRASSGNDRPF
jgi:hypothetical protein